KAQPDLLGLANRLGAADEQARAGQSRPGPWERGRLWRPPAPPDATDAPARPRSAQLCKAGRANTPTRRRRSSLGWRRRWRDGMRTRPPSRGAASALNAVSALAGAVTSGSRDRAHSAPIPLLLPDDPLAMVGQVGTPGLK